MASADPNELFHLLEDDEFALLEENAREFGLPWSGRPDVARRDVDAGDGHVISAIVWGGARPEIVLLHGGAQNAHTWDTVALALGRPLVALDLPGHGRSGRRADHDYTPAVNAAAVARAVEELAPSGRTVVGMSLGGLTAITVAARHPHLVERLVVVDVTPGVDRAKARAIVDFVSGPESFDSFEEILERTIAHNPGRSVLSLRRGVLHNAARRDDGKWAWRYDRMRGGAVDYRALWDDVSALTMPVLLVLGSESPVVGEEDVAEFLRRQPGLEVEVVEGAGHSVQGDSPVELARLIAAFHAG